MYKRIILPIDITDKSSYRLAFPKAVELAQACNAELTVLTVIPEFGFNTMVPYFPKGWMEDIQKKTTAELSTIVSQYVPADMKVTQLVERGGIYSTIIQTAERIHADLIMIVSNRPERRDYLLGTNAAKVVRHAKISVLVIRN